MNPANTAIGARIKSRYPSPWNPSELRFSFNSEGDTVQSSVLLNTIILGSVIQVTNVHQNTEVTNVHQNTDFFCIFFPHPLLYM